MIFSAHCEHWRVRGDEIGMKVLKVDENGDGVARGNKGRPREGASLVLGPRRFFEHCRMPGIR